LGENLINVCSPNISKNDLSYILEVMKDSYIDKSIRREIESNDFNTLLVLDGKTIKLNFDDKTILYEDKSNVPSLDTRSEIYYDEFSVGEYPPCDDCYNLNYRSADCGPDEDIEDLKFSILVAICMTKKAIN